MQVQVKNIIEKLDYMSPDRITEINDFIDFIRLRDQKNQLENYFSEASEKAFSRIWDNDEDAVYDTL